MACNTPLPAAWQLGSCASRCPTSPSPHVAHFGAGGSATSPRSGARSRVPVAVGTFRTQPGGAGEHGEIPVLASCSRRAHSSPVPRAGGDFRPPSLALGTSLTNIRGLAGGGTSSREAACHGHGVCGRSVAVPAPSRAAQGRFRVLSSCR